MGPRGVRRVEVPSHVSDSDVPTRRALQGFEGG